MVNLEQISVILGHPLILLLIGAGVSSLLIPWFTNRWQDHKKKLEIKVDIASKMTEAIAYQMANAFASISRKKKIFTDADKDAYFENMREWYIDANIISSKLESYFPETGIKKRWEYYYIVLISVVDASRQYFYEAPSAEQKDYLKYNLEYIRNYFSDNEQINWDRITTELTYDEDLWNSVNELVMERGDEITKDVLKLSIKIF